MLKHPAFKNLYIVDHPLVLDKLSRLRGKETCMSDFRRLLKEIALLIGYEVTRDLKLTTKPVETPMQTMSAPVLDGPAPVIVPILRAGQGMAEGVLELMPGAPVGYVGVYRDEETHRPVEYLNKLPPDEGQRWIVVDPMLATGHSAEHAFELVTAHGVPQSRISFMALVAAPEGVKVLEEAYPEIPVYVASLDEKLNEDAFIVPGLGDAGDRLFGTID